MRRLVIPALAVSALLCSPAAALAKSRQYNGPATAGPNSGVEFGGRLVGSRPVAVRRFSWFNLTAACRGYAPTATSDMLPITMRVNKRRRFHGSASINGGRVKVTVSGTFARDFGKATGTIRVRGSVPGCSSADTGTVRWRAPAVER